MCKIALDMLACRTLPNKASRCSNLLEDPRGLDWLVLDGAAQDKLVSPAYRFATEINALVDGQVSAGAKAPTLPVRKLQKYAAALRRRYAHIGMDMEADGEGDRRALPAGLWQDAIKTGHRQALLRNRDLPLVTDAVRNDISIMPGLDAPALRRLDAARVDLGRT